MATQAEDTSRADAAHAREQSHRSGARRLEAWRRAVLPFMMTVLAVLAAFFFLASVLQLYRLQDQVHQAPRFDDSGVNELFKTGADSSRSGATLELVRWRLLLALERNVVERRYHQASVLLAARVWIQYLGFVTGMILALVGAAFILGRLSDDSPSEIKGGGGDWSLDVRTASPGIALAVLGTALMALTLVIRHDIRVSDTPLYVRSVMPVTSGSGAAPGSPAAWPAGPEPGSPAVEEQDLERFKRETTEGKKK